MYATCAHKSNVVTRNDKSGGKFGRFSEEYPKYGTCCKIKAVIIS